MNCVHLCMPCKCHLSCTWMHIVGWKWTFNFGHVIKNHQIDKCTLYMLSSHYLHAKISTHSSYSHERTTPNLHANLFEPHQHQGPWRWSTLLPGIDWVSFTQKDLLASKYLQGCLEGGFWGHGNGQGTGKGRCREDDNRQPRGNFCGVKLLSCENPCFAIHTTKKERKIVVFTIQTTSRPWWGCAAMGLLIHAGNGRKNRNGCPGSRGSPGWPNRNFIRTDSKIRYKWL